MTTPRVLVVEHDASCPPALVGGWLEEAGCALETCRPHAGDAVPQPDTWAAYAGVLVLGGEMGAGDDATHAWLAPVRAGIEVAVRAQVPLLGICLGHQLTAMALGGTVAPNPRGQTVGLRPVGWTEAAADDAWTGEHTGLERSIHWNNDVVVELPSTATVLARTAGGEPQVVRYGPRAWGIQSHPEVDVQVLRGWVAGEREDEAPRSFDPHAVIAEVERHADDLRRDWRPFAERFAALVRATS